jgi:putative flippase GtrA
MKRFLMFFSVGSLGFVVDAGMTLLLVSGLNLPAMVGRLPAFVLATVVTYTLNRQITFPGQHASWARGWLLYVSATILGAMLNYMAYTLVLMILGERAVIVLLGIAAGSTIGLFCNYMLSLRVIFRLHIVSSVP